MTKSKRRFSLLLCVALMFSVFLADTAAHAGLLGGLLGGLGGVLGGVVRGAGGLLGGIFKGGAGILGGILKGGAGILGGIINGAGGLLGGLGKILGGILGGANNILGGLTNAVAPVTEALKTGQDLTQALEKVQDTTVIAAPAQPVTQNETAAPPLEKVAPNPDDEDGAVAKTPAAPAAPANVVAAAADKVEAQIKSLEGIVATNLPPAAKDKLNGMLGTLKSIKDAVKSAAEGKPGAAAEVGKLQGLLAKGHAELKDMVGKAEIIVSGMKGLTEDLTNAASALTGFADTLGK